MKSGKLNFGLALLIGIMLLIPVVGFSGGQKEAAPAPEPAPAPAAEKVYKGLILPNGEKMAPMEILTLTPGADPTLNQEAVFIAEWWKKIGIPIKAKAMEKGALVYRR